MVVLSYPSVVNSAPAASTIAWRLSTVCALGAFVVSLVASLVAIFIVLLDSCVRLSYKNELHSYYCTGFVGCQYPILGIGQGEVPIPLTPFPEGRGNLFGW